MTWRRGEAGSTLIDRPKDAPVPDFTNGKGSLRAGAHIRSTSSCLDPCPGECMRPGIEASAAQGICLVSRPDSSRAHVRSRAREWSGPD